MNKAGIVLTGIVLCFFAAACRAEEAAGGNSTQVVDFWRCKSLTNGFWGLNDKLAPSGIEIGAGITNIYQANVKGGTSTSHHRGRYTGSYDVEVSADLQRLLGFESGTLFLHLEGGWPDAEGIDPYSVGSAFGVNADAIGNDNILVKQLYYEGPLLSDNVTVLVGKIDFTGVFDQSAYAYDERSQFLNGAFVYDPTIPFPAYSLGVVVNWAVTDNWYLMGGAADAQADSRETGFRTAFHDEDYFFYALEAGRIAKLTSINGAMPGAYRLGMWVDGQDKARFSSGRNYRDDTGFYISCDQMIYKENNIAEDSQGVGVFGRFGYANSDLNPIGNFWSIGAQYEGPFESRDEDVLGIGFAQGIFSDYAGANDGGDFTENHENVLEIYYNARVTPWFNLSPGIQYISNTGGDETVKDAIVIGVRAQILL